VLAQFAPALARGEGGGDGERMDARADEQIGGAGALFVLDDARCVVAIFAVEPLDP